MDAMDKKNFLPCQTIQSLLPTGRKLFTILSFSEAQLNSVKALTRIHFVLFSLLSRITNAQYI